MLRMFLKIVSAILGGIFLPRPPQIQKATAPFKEYQGESLPLFAPDGRPVTYRDGHIHYSVTRTAEPSAYAGNYVYVPPHYTERDAYQLYLVGWEIEGPVEVIYCWNHTPAMHHFAGEFVRPLPGAKLGKMVSLCTQNYASRLSWRDYLREYGLDFV